MDERQPEEMVWIKTSLKDQSDRGMGERKLLRDKNEGQILQEDQEIPTQAKH